MKRDAKKSIATLKEMDQAMEGSILDVDQHVSAVIRVLREVNTTTISIFQSVMRFLTASKKQSKWSISRLVNKGEDQQESELENINNALHSLCGSEDIQSLQNRLENIESQFHSIEIAFEEIFRCLIKSRTYLLNIFSY
ncbi:hypothetical protein Leryth_006790 [Lithospermum erythrorhizon]|nr:hypothetical protein Leryth_006790 [Lithospermum erythrorhizon]